MPKRCFVYVDEADPRVVVHPETRGPRPHVLQQILSGNTSVNANIEDISPNKDKSAIKFAKTENTYWILIWADKNENIKNNQIIQNIAKQLGVKEIKECEHCK